MPEILQHSCGINMHYMAWAQSSGLVAGNLVLITLDVAGFYVLAKVATVRQQRNNVRRFHASAKQAAMCQH